MLHACTALQEIPTRNNVLVSLKLPVSCWMLAGACIRNPFVMCAAAIWMLLNAQHCPRIGRTVSKSTWKKR
ncbi:hypothetical protein WJX75_007520 [Coccomyxa subellipsoidea]|uniref:Uncharacterized protein n=1 Tax=Coccomyxa subellipsoidea TaxID=248742 RepID=A0ABR2Z4G5_9CHLO